MAETKIYLTNLKEVEKDFQNQGKSFDAAIKKSLKRIGIRLMGTQINTLSQRVIKWTGQLAKSIKYETTARSVTVGGTVKYTDWVEAGGRGGFMGYWYMRSSLKTNKGFILSELKKAMGVHAKIKA